MRRALTAGRSMMLVALAAVSLGGEARGQGRGSMEDQMACTPDVYRLCGSYVPDEDAIVGCLKRNVRVLSPACQRVFTRPDTPSTSPNGDNDDDE